MIWGKIEIKSSPSRKLHNFKNYTTFEIKLSRINDTRWNSRNAPIRMLWYVLVAERFQGKFVFHRLLSLDLILRYFRSRAVRRFFIHAFSFAFAVAVICQMNSRIVRIFIIEDLLVGLTFCEWNYVIIWVCTIYFSARVPCFQLMAVTVNNKTYNTIFANVFGAVRKLVPETEEIKNYKDAFVNLKLCSK